MEVMYETCCGIDVHQKTIVCCILDGPLDTNKPKSYLRTFGTTTEELQAALAWIESFGATHVFMESTGQYWVPVFNIFLEGNVHLILANPAHLKQVYGRKTDVKDAQWIAQLGRVGLVAGSFLPEEAALHLRKLTRCRLDFTQKITHIKNELHAILQRSNIKLTSYLSDIFTKTGQALLEVFINGEVIQLETVQRCLHGNVKATAEELLKAMNGRISQVDRYLLDLTLDQYRYYQKHLKDIEKRIETYIRDHFSQEYDLLMELPGIKQHSAAVILAEIGPNVEAFKTVGHLASWAGLAPGSHESAGIKKSSRTTRGNKYLKTTLIMCGGLAGRSRDPAFSALYHRVSARGSKMKAIVACGHKLLRIIYKILSYHVHYDTEKALGLRTQY